MTPSSFFEYVHCLCVKCVQDADLEYDVVVCRKIVILLDVACFDGIFFDEFSDRISWGIRSYTQRKMIFDTAFKRRSRARRRNTKRSPFDTFVLILRAYPDRKRVWMRFWIRNVSNGPEEGTRKLLRTYQLLKTRLLEWISALAFKTIPRKVLRVLLLLYYYSVLFVYNCRIVNAHKAVSSGGNETKTLGFTILPEFINYYAIRLPICVECYKNVDEFRNNFFSCQKDIVIRGDEMRKAKLVCSKS